MAERSRMTAADLVDKLLTSEHADVLRDSVAWLVAELMDAEVGELTGAELGERAPNTPAALVVRVAGSVRVALELDGGVAIVTRSAPG